jgi:hypothetical protein
VAEAYQPPDWFWDVLAATKPDIAALEAWLMAQPKQTVVQFGYAYDEAARDLVDYSAGVRVDGIVWSEDGTEDVCHWVVGQGRAYYYSVASGEVPLELAARAYADGTDRWLTTVTDPEHRGFAAPGSIANGVYRSRFGEELDDAIDELDA